MMISKRDINRIKEAYYKRFGREIKEEEAIDIAGKLLAIVKNFKKGN